MSRIFDSLTNRTYGYQYLGFNISLSILVVSGLFLLNLLVSIGTGNLTGVLKAEAAKNWGKLSWVDTLITMIFDGASDTVNYQLQYLIPEGNYHRFQPQLTFGQDEMDDASRANLISLKALAEGFIKDRQSDLNTISQRLVTNRLLNL